MEQFNKHDFVRSFRKRQREIYARGVGGSLFYKCPEERQGASLQEALLLGDGVLLVGVLLLQLLKLLQLLPQLLQALGHCREPTAGDKQEGVE